jgi:hypothetical protein
MSQSTNMEVVNQGWNATINPPAGTLSLSNNDLDPDLDYEVWRSSTDGNNTHTMRLVFTFGQQANPDPKLKNIFDLNGDGIVQEGERLVRVGELEAAWGLPPPPQPTLPEGFVAHEGVTTYYGVLPRYTLAGAWWEARVAQGREAAALAAARQGGGVRLSWQGLAGLTYTLQRSTTLAEADFQAAAPAQTLLSSGPQEVTLPETADRAFYRLKIERVPE